MAVACSRGSAFGLIGGAVTVGSERGGTVGFERGGTSWRRGLTVVGSCGGGAFVGTVGW